MKTQGVCPACDGTLTFWSAFKAPTPFTIRCPACKTKLRTVFPRLGLIFAIVLVSFSGVGGGALTLFIVDRITFLQFLAVMGCLTLLWLALEIVLGVLLFTYAKFLPRESKSS